MILPLLIWQPVTNFGRPRFLGRAGFDVHDTLPSDATGVSSSRQIERSTYENVAVRVLCADTHPDTAPGA